MKVIVAHNRYQSTTPSGENRIVESEMELLRAAGVDVIPFIEDSDSLRGASAQEMMIAAGGPVLSRQGVRRLNRLIASNNPDVLHIHNVYPLISPWVVRAAVSAGLPVVQSVHNYRHTCVAGMHMRDGAVCEDCRCHYLPWPAVRHACYRGSVCQSALMAVGQTVHRGTWRMVSRFLVASPQMEERLVSTGVDPARVEWRPTFAEDAGASAVPTHGGLAFVGRLEQAKGVELLLRAWTPAVSKRWGRLVIAGDGPLAGIVAAKASKDPTVEWRGLIGSEETRSVIRQCQAVVLPSIWYEGFPRVATEAMSLGRPLLMWSGAGFSRIADSGAGWTVEATPEAWAERLFDLDDASIQAAAKCARLFYESRCSPPVAVRQLLCTYAAVSMKGIPE